MIVINEASVFGLNFGAAIGVAIEVECEKKKLGREMAEGVWGP